MPSSTDGVVVASWRPVDAGGAGYELQTGSMMQLGQVTLYTRLSGQGNVKTFSPEPSSRTATGSEQAK